MPAQDVLFEAGPRAAEADEIARQVAAGKVTLLGECIRDYLRKVARRAVDAYVLHGMERREAGLYVEQDLADVAGSL